MPPPRLQVHSEIPAASFVVPEFPAHAERAYSALGSISDAQLNVSNVWKRYRSRRRDEHAYWVLTLVPVVVAQMFIGAGIGMGWAHLGTPMMGAAPPLERDIASSFISTTQLVSAALGSALAGIVVNTAGLFPHVLDRIEFG